MLFILPDLTYILIPLFTIVGTTHSGGYIHNTVVYALKGNKKYNDEYALLKFLRFSNEALLILFRKIIWYSEAPRLLGTLD